MSLIETIKKWYKGKFIKGTPTFTAHKDDKITIHLCTDRYEQYPLAKLFKYTSKCYIYFGKFWLSRWTVLLPIIITIILTLFIYFDSKGTRESQKKIDDTINKTYINHKGSK